jgi:hypothetical protein
MSANLWLLAVCLLFCDLGGSRLVFWKVSDYYERQTICTNVAVCWLSWYCGFSWFNRVRTISCRHLHISTLHEDLHTLHLFSQMVILTNSVAPKPWSSSLYLREPANGPYPELTGSTQHFPSHSLQDHDNSRGYFFMTPWPSQTARWHRVIDPSNFDVIHKGKNSEMFETCEPWGPIASTLTIISLRWLTLVGTSKGPIGIYP